LIKHGACRPFGARSFTGSATVAVARRAFSAIPEQKLVAYVLALIGALQHRFNTTPNPGGVLGKGNARSRPRRVDHYAAPKQCTIT
jgi:hypothetical protein